MHMALPFLNIQRSKKRTRMISVDLGTRTTKAVLLERRSEVWALSRYAVLDAPIFEKQISPELLTEHLKAVTKALDTPTRFVTLSLNLSDAVIRQVEMPHIPVADMRMVFKSNSKFYLQQDLAGHVFDCHIFVPKEAGKVAQSETSKAAGVPKLKVMVAAAKQQFINGLQKALRDAGLVGDCIVPGLVSSVNAFELALPEIFKNDTVALVDIGFKHTSICILDRGELVVTRVVNIGGERLTAGLAEMMNISYAEAEGIKIGMAAEVQSSLETLVAPLGRELRASLDFFEHQADRLISKVYFSGGSAQSSMILQLLQTEIVVGCEVWNPTGFLQMALPGQQAVEIEHIGPQLTVAVGAALAAF